MSLFPPVKTTRQLRRERIGRWTAVVGWVFYFVGLAVTMAPSEIRVHHFGERFVSPWTENVSIPKARFYGIMSSIIGLTFVWVTRRAKAEADEHE